MSKLTQTALRRLPLREAIAALTAPGASGATPLGPRVTKLTIRYLPKMAPHPGPRNFIKTVAPRIAYHNPNLPISVERIPVPNAHSKKLNPAHRDFGVEEWTDGPPPQEVILELSSKLDDAPPETIDMSELSSTEIWQKLFARARGEPDPNPESETTELDPSALPPSPEAPPPVGGASTPA